MSQPKTEGVPMFTRLMPVAVLAAALLLPLGASADPTGDCTRGSHPIFGELIRPQDGMVQAQTTPTGALSVQTGVTLPATFVSTTGQIEVEFEYACLQSLTLTVTKEGEPTPVHTNTFDVACEHDTGTDVVEIGLDAGTFSFELSGTTCTGAPITSDGRGGFVADPPVL